MEDLGTYHVKVEFHNAIGFIVGVNTGLRFTHGTYELSPLHATMIKPIYRDEIDLISNIIYYYTEGNASCDCNKRLAICRAYNEEEPKDNVCGYTILLKRLTLIKPDITTVIIWGK